MRLYIFEPWKFLKGTRYLTFTDVRFLFSASDYILMQYINSLHWETTRPASMCISIKKQLKFYLYNLRIRDNLFCPQMISNNRVQLEFRKERDKRRTLARVARWLSLIRKCLWSVLRKCLFKNFSPCYVWIIVFGICKIILFGICNILC